MSAWVLLFCHCWFTYCKLRCYICAAQVLGSKETASLSTIHAGEYVLVLLCSNTVDVALNLPTLATDIFVADISHCYETIPTSGTDALSTVVQACINIVFWQAQVGHKVYHKLFIWFDHTKVQFSTVRWATHSPPVSTWIEFTSDRSFELHHWFMSSCFV